MAAACIDRLDPLTNALHVAVTLGLPTPPPPKPVLEAAGDKAADPPELEPIPLETAEGAAPEAETSGLIRAALKLLAPKG